MRPRFQHILVPIDFTQKNVAALDIAFDLASQNRARTTLLHVVESIESEPDDDDDEELREFYQQLGQRATTDLEGMSQRFSEAGLDVEFKVWVGNRVQEIVRCITEREVDLVVLSSHPIDAERPAQSLATVSYAVSIVCPCPVLMVK